MSYFRCTFILLLLIAVFPIRGFGKTSTVQTEYIYQLPENVALEDGKDMALQRAKIQAIADEYGTIVTQTATTNIDILNGETTTDFLSIGGSEVKGEWIETIGTPQFDLITDGGQVAIRVRVKGKIRETEGSKIPFDVKILRNGITTADENESFMSGDSFYLSFCSPVSGYLAVYLIDAQKQAYCLLPYQSVETGNFKTKANKQYLFFHPDYAEDMPGSMVDEYVFDASENKERNRILAVFSPNRFFKAVDQRTSIDLPRNLGYADFQKWLSDVKKRDTDMAIIEKSITISAIK